MSQINEKYIIDQYVNHLRSANDISKELGTYPKKISRILAKNGYDIRDRSQAQKTALEIGKSTHPTAGKKRTEEEKKNIAIGLSNRWHNLPEEKKKEFSDAAKKRWENMSEFDKQELQSAAGRALRIAGIEGSKAERFLRKKFLEELDYEVVLHKKGLIPGKHEIDIFLPEIKTVIEIDGPQHFLPVWGEAKLNDTIRYDSEKNGLLLSAGYKVIRVKYLCTRMSRAIGEKMWALIRPIIDNIANGTEDRFIEVEISMEK